MMSKSIISKLENQNKQKRNIGDIYLQYHHLCNDGSEESIDSNNRSKEGTDSRFKVVFKEELYKYSLVLDTAQCPSVIEYLNAYMKEADLIKTTFIKS